MSDRYVLLEFENTQCRDRYIKRAIFPKLATGFAKYDDKELETTKRLLEESLLILKSIKDDDGSRYNRPGYYPIIINFLNKLKNERGE